MKWALTFLFSIIVVGIISLIFIYEPGHIVLTWLGYEAQFSVFLAFFLLLFSLSIIAFFRWAIIWLLAMPNKWLSCLKRSQKEKANNELLKLLVSYESEEIETALDHQRKASTDLSLNPFFLWLSGNVFEKSEKYLEAERYFVDLIKNPSTIFLGLKGQIRAALHRGDFLQAYDLLKRAEKVAPTSPWVLKHLLALARQQNKWEEAEVLTLRLEDLGYLTSEQSKKQIAQSQYQQSLESKTSVEQKEAFLRQVHDLDPSLS